MRPWPREFDSLRVKYVYRTMRHGIGRDDAEDIVQDAMIGTVRAWWAERVKPHEVDRYLCGCVVRQEAEFHRRQFDRPRDKERRQRIVPVPLFVAEEMPAPEAVHTPLLWIDGVLTAQEAGLLRSHFADGYAMGDLADGVSVATVQYRKKKALEKLSEALAHG